MKKFNLLIPSVVTHFGDDLPSQLVVNGETQVEDTDLKAEVLEFLRLVDEQPTEGLISWMLRKIKTTSMESPQRVIISSLAHLSPVPPEAVDALLQALASSSDPYARARVLDEVVSNHLSGERILQAAVASLRDADPLVRSYALRTALSLDPHAKSAAVIPALRILFAVLPALV